MSGTNKKNASPQFDSIHMSREELYQAFNDVGKEEFVRSEVIRLGFWDPNEVKSDDALVKAREELATVEKQLAELKADLGAGDYAKRKFQEAHAKRIEESRQKQAERKKQREIDRKARQVAWKQFKQGNILFLGEDVSMGLSHTAANPQRLQKLGLTPILDVLSLSKILGTTVNDLRVFGFFRPVSRFNHYTRFTIPKKTGGQRVISAPLMRLKQLQHKILEEILTKVPIHDAAHGFAPGRSVYSNAIPHVGTSIVINMDLQDFFPTLTFERVKGIFLSLGYSGQISTVLALLCTEANTTEVELDGQKWYIAQGQRFLPQGAPTSPMLSNIVCYHMDTRLQGLASKLGLQYTRYADDITFSATDKNLDVSRLIKSIRKIVQEEGFVVHPNKTKVMRDGQRKEVTGVVVNEKTSIERHMLRKFRALLHQIEKDGPTGKTWGECDDVLSAALGYASFVKLVDPSKGDVLHRCVMDLCAKYR